MSDKRVSEKSKLYNTIIILMAIPGIYPRIIFSILIIVNCTIAICHPGLLQQKGYAHKQLKI